MLSSNVTNKALIKKVNVLMFKLQLPKLKLVGTYTYALQNFMIVNYVFKTIHLCRLTRIIKQPFSMFLPCILL